MTSSQRFLHVLLLLASSSSLAAQTVEPPEIQRSQLPVIDRVDAQPLLLLTQRLVEALETLGSPLAAEVQLSLAELKQEPDDAKVTVSIQRILDPLCIAAVEIKDDGSVQVVAGRSVKVEENG